MGNVKKEWLLPLIVPGVAGGSAGAYFLSSMPGNTMKPYIAGFIALLGIIVFYRFASRKAASRIDPEERGNLSHWTKSPIKLPIMGLIAAFVDVVGGGRWGLITTPGLILSENSEPSKVVGTVNLVEFFITVAIAATFTFVIGWESFEWGLVIALIIGGVIAAPIAALLCKKLPTNILGMLIGILLTGLNLRTLLITLW